MDRETPLSTGAPFTLAQARERLRFLLAGGERNAWEIGDLLNKIEKSQLVRSEGYWKTRTWIEAQIPEAKGKTSTLYRYANVAAQYSKAHVDRWGIAKLYCLMLHDGQTHEIIARGDPAEREIQLLRADGSILVKQFRYCTCRELRTSQQQKKAPTQTGPAQKGEEPDRSQSAAAISAESMDFLKEQMAEVVRRSRKLFWPFTRAG